MKFILVLIGSVFILMSCQTTSSATTAKADKDELTSKFSFQKITSSGIQQVTLSPKKDSSWPEIATEKRDGLAVNSQGIVMAVIGDTGCRLKESKTATSYQKCNQANEWAYPDIVRQIANEKIDLVVHVGDYLYREKCTNVSICQGIAKHSGLGWNSWWDDFYGPTQELFKRVPFLFVRGNHEDCHRAFRGWKAMSSLPQTSFDEFCEQEEPYQWIEIGDLVFINFDDSAFEDKKTLSDAERLNWINKLKTLSEKISSQVHKKEIWLLTHKPVLGFIPNKDDAEPEAISDNLYLVLKESGVLSQIDYVLSGHIHNQQIVISEPEFKQFIVGHSGTSIEPFGRPIMNEKMISTTVTAKSFGYALFERHGFKKWKVIYKNTSGHETLSCDLNKQKINCDFENQ